MATFREFFKDALVEIGALAPTQTPSAVEIQSGLRKFNRFLDSMSTEKLIVPTKAREEFSLVSGTQSYTIGPSGTFNTGRPLAIEVAKIEDQTITPTPEYPLDLIDLNQWANIVQKDIDASIPTKLYYEETYPLGILHFWPKPQGSLKAALYMWKALTQIANADTTIAFPQGYEYAFLYNFALALCSEYGKEPSATLLSLAIESKANIKSLNIKDVLMSTELATVSQPNYYKIFSGK